MSGFFIEAQFVANEITSIRPHYPLFIRNHPRFFDQVGYQTTNVSSEISIFSLNNDLVRLTKIMNKLVKDLKILSFKVISKSMKLVKSSPQETSLKNI